jgi:hypothetical protein
MEQRSVRGLQYEQVLALHQLRIRRIAEVPWLTRSGSPYCGIS